MLLMRHIDRLAMMGWTTPLMLQDQAAEPPDSMEPNCLSLVLAGIMAVGTIMSAGCVHYYCGISLAS